MEVDYPNCNGRFHRMCDDSVTVLILGRVPHTITLRIAMAVCRKWRALIKQHIPVHRGVFSGSWWEDAVARYLHDYNNTDADMECLRRFFTRHPTRYLAWSVAFQTAIAADRPSVVRMCMAQHVGTPPSIAKNILRPAIIHQSRKVIEDVALPTMFGFEGSVFDMMLVHATFDLFRWYCNNYHAHRTCGKFDGVGLLMTHGQEKIKWMASTGQWPRSFWRSWLQSASGLPDPLDSVIPGDRHFNTAVWIAEWAFKGRLPCNETDDGCYLSTSTPQARLTTDSSRSKWNADMRDRLREFCPCRPRGDVRDAAEEGPVKRARVWDEDAGLQ